MSYQGSGAMEPFKRKFNADGTEDRLANYYVRFMVRSKPYLWCTKTNDISLARKRAKKYWEAVKEENYHLADSMKTRNNLPDFEAIFKQYKELPLTVTKDTRVKNIAGMREILKANGLDDDTRIDRLSANVVVEFQKAGLAAGIPASTLNSRLRAAKSIFSARALLCYHPPLPLAYVDDMKRAPSLREPEKMVELPSDELIAHAHRVLPATPDLYRCFLLAFYAGMRAGEIGAARWDWLDGDVIYIGGRDEFHAKSRKWRVVRLAPVIVKLLEEAGEKDPVHIAGEYPVRTATRLMAPMLKALGIKLRNPTHAGRRWAGSLVAAASGLHAAQHMLGHSSPVVTAKAYARVLNAPAAVPMLALTAALPPSPSAPPQAPS